MLGNQYLEKVEQILVNYLNLNAKLENSEVVAKEIVRYNTLGMAPNKSITPILKENSVNHPTFENCTDKNQFQRELVKVVTSKNLDDFNQSILNLSNQYLKMTRSYKEFIKANLPEESNINLDNVASEEIAETIDACIKEDKLGYALSDLFGINDKKTEETIADLTRRYNEIELTAII